MAQEEDHELADNIVIFRMIPEEGVEVYLKYNFVDEPFIFLNGNIGRQMSSMNARLSQLHVNLIFQTSTMKTKNSRSQLSMILSGYICG